MALKTCYVSFGINEAILWFSSLELKSVPGWELC